MKFSQLKSEDIDNIRDMLDMGIKQKDIANKYGISQSDVSRIKTGKTYNNFPGLMVHGVSASQKQILLNIAKNKGVDGGLSYFVRTILNKEIENTPEHLKRKPMND